MLDCGSVIGARSIFWGVKRAEIDVTIIDLNPCPPLARCARWKNTFQGRMTAVALALVLGVLAIHAFAKIQFAIVVSVSIDMVGMNIGRQ